MSDAHRIRVIIAIVLLTFACAAVSGCDGGGLSSTSLCGDTLCQADRGESCESCPDDCGACPPCGDGLCAAEEGESCESCPADCGGCAVCGDGSCDDSDESCESCPDDCGACPPCGDGLCDPETDEDCDTCPADCGDCDPCGDELCAIDVGETCESCPDDCGECEPCGDGECAPDQGEDCDTCPADCGECPLRDGCVQGDFAVYYGNLHSHTSYSDGEARPAVAFDHARDQGLDFLYVTDHRRRLTSTEWSQCRSQANDANDNGTFVAGCGYEVNDNAYGHLNVLFTSTMMPHPSNLADVWDGLVACSPCVGQFNHPPRPTDFHGYRYVARAGDAMRMMELSGGAPFADKWASFFQALDNGWLLSPSQNEDNHHRNWGDSPRATGVWLPTLSRRALRRAVRARRTFSTTDETASIRIMADSVCWMGSVLSGFGPTEITVVARDRQGRDGFDNIRLFGPGRTRLRTHHCDGANPCRATFSFDVTEETYFVARANQDDGGLLVSGPIWFVR